jgi:hypothetical protein
MESFVPEISSALFDYSPVAYRFCSIFDGAPIFDESDG